MSSPLDHLDSAIGKRVWILLKGDKELEGDLVGVDEFVNMVMENVVEFQLDAATGQSQETGVKVKELLLNGNNVVMIVQGGRR
ncbi:hypothetical protein BASA81_012613 [Batrachochytrium salamandrivorans]|nr:hypothetical protein BASA81_012613 [Batrachochytrium salamandrivorans]